ncbi:MAG: glutamate-5-semialdehyde dehydrogenase [Clostridia bacterium]|nr:glutamate-5-semialdehyde dehydrogenase [Clostridia bacterium]
MDMQTYITDLCRAAKTASASLASASTAKKNAALAAMADALAADRDVILAANARDLATATDNGVPSTMLDRLRLTEARIDGICAALRELIGLADPIGSGERWVRPNGLIISRVRVPMGVVGMIYEARPNVTVDAAALCLKTGNAVVLRGGKEAIETNRALVASMKAALVQVGLDPDVLALVERTEREGVSAMLTARGLLDVVIPRGGAGLIRTVVEQARIPVIETGAGNCHLYVDETADLEMAVRVAINAKASRPSVCNAIETMLVHASVAAKFLPAFAEAAREAGVTLRGCPRTKILLPDAEEATDADWATEYNDYILAVRVVDTLGDAIAHINRYNTGHSEAIITRSREAAARFQREVDAAAVYVNASTRFTDGGEFGFGAEIGISTQKLHARGPMGLTALTTDKYLVDGVGQVR